MDPISDRSSSVNRMDLDPQRSCYRKVRFSDEKFARKRADQIGLEAYFCDVCAGFHLTNRLMAGIQTKDFLRQNGFRHLRDSDRGAVWGNGVADIFVEKSYKENSKLRAMMDQVRAAAKKKSALKAAEDKKLSSDFELTPEQHRIQQVEMMRAEALKPQVPEPPPVPIAIPIVPEVKEEPIEEADGIKRRKFSGDERLYVFGRLKAMLSTKMDDAAIAAALISEGVKMPSGEMVSSKYIYQMRANWKAKPDAKNRYASILMPRKVLSTVVPEPARPVVIAPPRTVPRSRFAFPLSIDTVLNDPEVGDAERLQILLIFVSVPVTAEPVLNDTEVSARQKLSVVEALGKRKDPKNDSLRSHESKDGRPV